MLERLAGERPVGHLPDGPADGARDPGAAAAAARAAGPHRRAQRGAAARDRAARCAATARTGRRGCAPSPPVTTREPRWSTARRPALRWRCVGRVGELLAVLEEEPAGLLRSGGVGVRDQKRLARVLHVGEPEAGWLLELAYAAGLLDVGGPHRDEWLPTRAYDLWREQDLPDRWAALAAGWLAGVRLPSLVGQRDVAGKAVNALSPDLVRHTAPAIRRSALTVLAEFPPGTGLAADDLVALLRWRTPRRADRLAPVPDDARRGRAAGRRRRRRAVHRRARPAGHGADGAADGMRGLLPEPVDHVLAQPDLSLVAPGPLVAELADTLAVVADVESSGGATVFRVSESSVRRALDAGWSADRPARLLRAGLAHAGAAGAGLPGRRRRPAARPAAGRAPSSATSAPTTTACCPRCSTTGARRRRSCAGWRPGVLVSGLGADEVLTVLRDAGYAPAGENPGAPSSPGRPARPAGGRPADRHRALPRPAGR